MARWQLLEQGHRKHHEQPQAHDSLPFFLPPLVALALVGILSIALPATVALLFTGGMAAGYAAYGLTHSTIPQRCGSAARWPDVGPPRITSTTFTRTATSA